MTGFDPMLLAFCLGAYLLGAVPCGYIIGKVFYGVDLKTVGSGNIGATNAYRVLGAKAGLAVFLCDFAKGMLAVSAGNVGGVSATLLCALFVIVGNDWSVFLHFKSGRGVACGVGAFAALWPMAALGAFIVWLAVFMASKIVSLASICAAPAVPIVIWLTGGPDEFVVFGAAAAAVIIFKHKDNIGRLMRGEEKKITRGKR